MPDPRRMALRSQTRTAVPTSGPGRGPLSDGRTSHNRHRHRRGRPSRARAWGRDGDRQDPGEEIRRRAETLFGGEPGDAVVRGGRPARGARRAPSWARPELGAGRALAGVKGGAPPSRPRRRVVVVDRHGVAGHALLTRPRSGASAVDQTLELRRLPDRAGAPSVVAGSGGGADAAARPGRFLGVGPEGEEPATYPVRLPDPADRETPDGMPESEPPPDSPSGRLLGPALRERLPLWVQARCGLERRSVVALSALLALALVFAVQHFWTGRTQPVRAPEVVRAAPAAQGKGMDGGGGDPSGAPDPFGQAGGTTGQAGGTTAPEIVVDVSGKVRDPGVHRLPAGSRVEDALKAAGGVRPGTKTGGLNRARFLVDGEQLVVGGPAPAAAAAPRPRRARERRRAPRHPSPSTPPPSTSSTPFPVSARSSPSTSSTTAPATAVSARWTSCGRSTASATAASPTYGTSSGHEHPHPRRPQSLG